MIRKWSILLAVVVCLGVLVSCSQLKNDTAITTGNTDEIFSPNTDYNTTSDTTETNNDMASAETTLSVDDAHELQLYEFMKSYEYISVQNTAFNFFKAYINADFETAQALMDDKDNECLSYFSSVERSLDSVDAYSFELVNYKLLDDGHYQIPWAHVDIGYRLHDWDSVVYMGISMNYVDKITQEGDTYKQWVVTFYDFEA